MLAESKYFTGVPTPKNILDRASIKQKRFDDSWRWSTKTILPDERHENKNSTYEWAA